MSVEELFLDVRYGLERIIAKVLPPAKEKPSYKYDITFVLMIRDEAEYVDEWLRYHTALFAGKTVHFHVFDNRSTDNLKEILAPYIKCGTVSYSYCGAQNYPQSQLYNHAVWLYRKKSHLMACIDTDEFLVPTDPDLDVWQLVADRIIPGGGMR